VAVSVSSEAAGSVPPHNLEAETSVLGAILLAEQALDGVLIDVKLSPEDFYRERHRLIFRAMLRLKEKSVPEPVDALTVSEELTRSGELEEAGGTAYVHSLPNLVPAAGNARHYGKIVKEHALLRRLLDTTRDIQEKALAVKGQPSELVEQAEQAMYKIAHDEHASEIRSIEAVLHDELDKLEQISREGVSLIGTPSGFRDLDDITGGFQPGNLIVLAARPAMGKCLVGSSLVYDPGSGSRVRIDELVARRERGEELSVAALGSDFKLRPARASLAARNGRKPVFRLTTRLGRRVEATANHPLLTGGGWRELRQLGPGDRIAVPRTLPASTTQSMPAHELVLLAALIADGNLTQKTPRFCFGPQSPVLPEVERAAAAVGCRLQCSERSNGTATISAGRGARTNPVRELMREHGLWGKRSGDKFVPDRVFTLGAADIARFLGILFACDGHIYASDRLRQIGYTTISERLARDVQHLLLRLGIVSCIRRLKRDVYAGTEIVAREVRITGQEGLLRFIDRVAVPGKTVQAERLRSGLARAPRATNVDTIPAQVWSHVLAVKGERPWSAVSTATGRPSNHNWHVGTRGLSRGLLGELAEWSGDDHLRNLATSDVWWDEVVSVEAIGEAETYDIAVPDGHNFVADDVIVHNSALVVNIAENAAVDHDKAVALFSLEMSETELAQRFIASQAKLDGDELRKGRVKPDRWPKVIRATEQLSRAQLFIDDSSDLGVLELRAKARRLHQRNPLGLLIVDYLQLMRAEDPRDGRVEQVGKISRGLKILARELHVPVIAVSQLSRAVESRPDKRPLLSDLRESGSIEQDADVVLFIYRDEYYNRETTETPGEAEVIVSKHRNGPVGKINLAFMERYPKFANLWRDHGGVATGTDANGTG
jgi:replicative DNA helicase